MSTLRVVAMLPVVLLVTVSVCAQDTTSVSTPLKNTRVTVLLKPQNIQIGSLRTNGNGEICFGLPTGAVIGGNSYFQLTINVTDAAKAVKGINRAASNKISIAVGKVPQDKQICIALVLERSKPAGPPNTGTGGKYEGEVRHF
jgi:hypothetical protein